MFKPEKINLPGQGVPNEMGIIGEILKEEKSREEGGLGQEAHDSFDRKTSGESAEGESPRGGRSSRKEVYKSNESPGGESK